MSTLRLALVLALAAPSVNFALPAFSNGARRPVRIKRFGSGA